MNLPSVEINRTMYVTNPKNKDVWTVFATHESASAKSILTDCGRVYRTNTKHIKIMNSYDYAILAIKTYHKEFDDEYKALIKKLKIRLTRK